MGSHLYVADSGYHHLMVEEVDQDIKESFFNQDADYEFSSTQFRFSLPGQHLTDDYRRHIRGFFQNEPCIYNHAVFGHASRLFDAMKHPPEAFQSNGNKLATAMKQVVSANVQQQQQQQPAPRVRGRRQSLSVGQSDSRIATSITSASSAKSKGKDSSRSRPKYVNEIELPEIEFASENEKRLTYQLVFQTLKCMTFFQWFV